MSDPMNRVFKMQRPAVRWLPYLRVKRAGAWRFLPVLINRYAAEFYHSGYGWAYDMAFTRRTCERRHAETRRWFASQETHR